MAQRYFYKCYLWENGQKGTDYTNKMISPFFFEDRLNEELDSGEIVLESMPIESKADFPPKTKFRVELYQTDPAIGQEIKPLETWDLCVEHDDVEEYEGLPGVCCHRISCQEPSIVAQGMHVDNIALTYELQDVSMNYKTTTEDKSPVAVVFVNWQTLSDYSRTTIGNLAGL
jgi:hypothetical protein